MPKPRASFALFLLLLNPRYITLSDTSSAALSKHLLSFRQRCVLVLVITVVAHVTVVVAAAACYCKG